MKYLRLHVAFSGNLNSINNMKKALQRIGEVNPFNIKRTTLRVNYIKKETLSEKDYFNRGILNVRKELNKNLGKNGKYKNKMIRLSSKVKTSNKGEGFCSICVPHAEFIKIINATYTLLSKVDPAFCKKLLDIEIFATYKPKSIINKVSNQTVAPVQTHIINMSESTLFNKKQYKDLKDAIRR